MRIVLGLALVLALPLGVAAQSPKGWLTRAEDAFAEARKHNKPILAIVHCFY